MFGLSFLNPWLLGGAALVGVPILIHLLNQRRFKTMDWAAMEFLLEADRRNRRRVRLEHLILLLLRCLAVLLLVLLVARPFLKPSVVAAVLPSSVERVVILDDSPSMGAVSGNQTALGLAVERLKGFLRTLARERSSDTFTLILTSRPDRPLYRGEVLGTDRVEQILRGLEALRPADVPARYAAAFAAADDLLHGPGPAHANRLIYILSDLRRWDWLGSAGAAERSPAANPVIAGLQRLTHDAGRVTVVDVGQPVSGNLTLEDLAPVEGTLAAGVDTHWQATVRNYGDTTVDDAQVTFKPAHGPDLRRSIGTLAPGQRATVPFTYVFSDPGWYAVEADLGPDSLAADNARYFAADVVKGTSVLLVDGDPGSDPTRNETFYLEHALNPPGNLRSGNTVEVVTEGQFEGMPLDSYQLIVICNLYRLSEERCRALRAWTQAGGGLVFFLGDQIDAQAYNDQLFQGGRGLLPVQLLDIRGDEQKQRWVNPAVAPGNDPLTTVFRGAQNPFTRSVKVFRYWATAPALAAAATQPAAPGAAGGAATTQPRSARVLANWTDTDNSPAIVERAFGRGRVVVFTTAADADWSNWPGDPSYAATMLTLSRTVARRTTDQGALRVTEPIHYDLDAARYRVEARMVGPDGEPAAVTATGAQTASGRQGRLALRYDGTERAGFYRLELTAYTGAKDTVLFAANGDPREGDLTRAEVGALQKELGDAKVTFTDAARGLAASRQATLGSELWRPVLVTAVIVLCLEQMLAWAFGRRR